MGEFGRTPRINQNAGRDHWPRSWSVVMGGGGMKGGQAVGATDKDGVDIVDRPVGVMDLIATMTKTMGINLDTQYTTPRGRPMKVVDGGNRSRSWWAKAGSVEPIGIAENASGRSTSSRRRFFPPTQNGAGNR